MKNIKVTVIMPVYNAAEYLRESLDCLTKQTLQDIEIICVDDGSTDESLCILEEYSKKDNRFMVLSQKNLHAGVARNNGIDHASGEYMIFLDADDLFELELLEKTYKQGIQQDADIVLFDADYFNTETGERLVQNHLLRTELLDGKEVFSRKDIPDRLFTITTTCPWTKLYSRKFIEKYKLRFQNLRHSNDVYFVLSSLALAERITYLNEKLVYYRVNQTKSLQSLKATNPTLFFDAYEAVYKLLNERHIYEELEKSFITTVLSGCVFNIDTVHSNDAKRKIYEKIESSEFKAMNILAYPEDYYINREYYRRIKSVPYILNCLRKRNRRYEKNGFRVIQQNRVKEEIAVSVIIPVYNTEKYLKSCLESIQEQSLKNIEIICINDGSTDKSLSILKQISKLDKRVSVYTEENSGQSVARNRGLSVARGKYIYFMDSDDLLDANALKKLYSKAENEKLDIVYFDGTSFLDDDLDESSSNQNLDYYKRKYWYSGVYKGEKMLLALVKNGEYRVSPCLQLIRNEYLKNMRISFEEGIIHEDNLFTYQTILGAERVGHIHEGLFKRRYRAASTMTQKTTFEHVYGYFKCFLKMGEYIEKINIDDPEKEAALFVQKDNLRNAREKYMKLEYEEKEAAKGLDLNEKLYFEAYIEDWFAERKAVWNANNRAAREIANEIANVKNTETFKLGAAIIWLPRKIKQCFLNIR